MTRFRRRVASAAFVLAFAGGLVRADSPGGRFLSPSPGESLAPGAIVEVRWASLCQPDGRRAERDEAEIILSLDGGLTFPVRVSSRLSPCETRFLWRVPMLATGRARLAVRSGTEGFGRTERIAFVTGDFRILSDLDGRVQELYRRAAEWWTPPEATVLTAEDLFGGAMSSAEGRMLAACVTHEIGAPSSPVRSIDSRACAGRVAPAVVQAAALGFPRSLHQGAATPLRL